MNPNYPEIKTGNLIRTLDKNGNILSESPDVSIDGSSFSKFPMAETEFSFDLSSPFAGEFSDYKISFKSNFASRDGEKCFVKMSIPPELDFS